MQVAIPASLAFFPPCVLVFVTWDDKSMAGVATARGGMVVGVCYMG